jgi:hypothetical protein
MPIVERRITFAFFCTCLLLLGSAMIACRSKVDEVQYKASCDKRESLSECNEYSAGTLAERREFLRKSCVTTGGRFADGVCPADGAEVGRCELAGERRRYFSGGRMRYTPAAAQHLCQVIEGSWVSTR